MTMLRSGIMGLTLVCLTFQFAANGWAQTHSTGSGQGYPAKTVRIVVPSSAGSGADVIGRIIAEGLTQVFGQQVIVENRGGASSTIGAEIVARAPADGYTMLQGSMTLAANVSLYRKLSYDLLRDFAAVTLLAVQPHILVVHPSLPAKSVTDLIRLAKAKPGALNYSSASAGTSTHLAAELFKHLAGVDMLHVPYNGGGPALTAVLTGETTVYFAPIPTSLPHIRQGKLRPLAVTTAERFTGTPEYPTAYPTIAEEGGLPGYELVTWYGLLVPAKTPEKTIATIHRAAVSALNKPDVKKRVINLAYVPVGNQPDEFTARIKSDIAKVAKIVQQSGATAN